MATNAKTTVGGGTKCSAADTTKITDAYTTLNTKSLAYTTLVNAETNLKTL